MNDALSVLNSIVQILSLVFLVIYVIKTWEMASATRKAAEATARSVEEMREARDQESAPYVVAYFDIPVGSYLIYLVVKNIGKSVAKNVKMQLSPGLMSSTENNLGALSIVNDGIGSMPPEFEIRTILDGANTYFGRSDLPLKYHAAISYSGGISNVERHQEQILDLSAYVGVVSTTHKNINHVVEELKNLVSETHSLQDAVHKGVRKFDEALAIGNAIAARDEMPGSENEWRVALTARLREFLGLWNVAYARSLEDGTGLAQIQSEIAQYSRLLLRFAASIPASANSEIATQLTKVVSDMRALAKSRFYMDGGASLTSFRERGISVTQAVEGIIALFSEESAVADLADAQSGGNSEDPSPSI